MDAQLLEHVDGPVPLFCPYLIVLPYKTTAFQSPSCPKARLEENYQSNCAVPSQSFWSGFLRSETLNKSWLQKSGKIGNDAKTKFEDRLQYLRTLLLKGIKILPPGSAVDIKGLTMVAPRK